MGASSDSKGKKSFNLEDIPLDQYSCIECGLVPEIKKVDFNEGLIKLKCKNHENSVYIKDYFRKETKFLYDNFFVVKNIKIKFKKNTLIFSIIFQKLEKIYAKNAQSM